MVYNRGTGECGYEFLNSNFQSTGLLKITAFNNYDDSSSATITSDQKTLVMGIETDMTQGGMDLYFTTQKEDGTYGFLQNMGKTINSAANEGMVNLLSDQKTLLLAVMALVVMATMIFILVTDWTKAGKKWSEPVNLGSKINSSGFEGSPFYDEKAKPYILQNG